MFSLTSLAAGTSVEGKVHAFQFFAFRFRSGSRQSRRLVRLRSGARVSRARQFRRGGAVARKKYAPAANKFTPRRRCRGSRDADAKATPSALARFAIADDACELKQKNVCGLSHGTGYTPQLPSIALCIGVVALRPDRFPTKTTGRQESRQIHSQADF